MDKKDPPDSHFLIRSSNVLISVKPMAGTHKRGDVWYIYIYWLCAKPSFTLAPFFSLHCIQVSRMIRDPKLTDAG